MEFDQDVDTIFTDGQIVSIVERAYNDMVLDRDTNRSRYSKNYSMKIPQVMTAIIHKPKFYFSSPVRGP